MSERLPRKRIPLKKVIIGNLVADELEFTKNICSVNARKVKTHTAQLTVDIWFDKHYYEREQHGDENGQRDGIDKPTVENLVLRAIDHLILYSTIINGFSFLNYGDGKYNPVLNPKRIIIQEPANESVLNVAIEAHFIDRTKYEITVKTAMQVDDFRISDGQYVIEIQGDSSILKKNQRGGIVEIMSI